MSEPIVFSWEKIHRDCDLLSSKLQGRSFTGILSVTRGGLVPASQLARGLDIKRIETIGLSTYEDQNDKGMEHLKQAHDIDGDGRGWLVVDDLCDTGNTFKALRNLYPQAKFVCLYVKEQGKPQADMFIEERPQDQWIYFPWELHAGFSQKSYKVY